MLGEILSERHLAAWHASTRAALARELLLVLVKAFPSDTLLPGMLARALRSHARRLHGAGTRALQVIDCHAAGEPARVVVGGLPTIPGGTIFEKRQHMMDEMDGLRKLLKLPAASVLHIGDQFLNTGGAEMMAPR